MKKAIKNGKLGELVSINGILMDDILKPLSFEEILDNLYYQCMPKNRHRINKKVFIKQLKFFVKELSTTK